MRFLVSTFFGGVFVDVGLRLHERSSGLGLSIGANLVIIGVALWLWGVSKLKGQE